MHVGTKVTVVSSGVTGIILDGPDDEDYFTVDCHSFVTAFPRVALRKLDA